MVTKAQKIRLGVFITISVFLLLAIIIVLSLNRFKEKDIYYIAYKNISVTGLDVGSSVKYLGINVGTVQKIQIDPKDISRIIVTVGLKKDTPIKSDARADISTIGITGIKLIEIRGGTNDAPFLKPGDYITAGTSLTENITGKAEVIGEKVELLLNNLLKMTNETNQEKLFALVDTTHATISRLNKMLGRNEQSLRSAVQNLDSTLYYLAATGKSAKHAADQVDFFVSSDTFKITLDNIAQIADKLNKANIYNLDEQLNLAVDKINHILSQMDVIISMNLSKFNRSMETLNSAIESLNHAAQQIDENPAILLKGSKPQNPPDDKLEQ